ncbi:hypothetical protein [Caldalkalibacillus salinus]|uniref:hypothetical protein n=1 Tax=Caldalkalibacillus salinus TaxID=2803787 RepID=UPI0019234831|nr:hypothetical protein [Caldalkalibacillus salinus]
MNGITLFIGLLVVIIFVAQILVDRSLAATKEEIEVKMNELEERIEKLERNHNEVD